MSNDNSPIDRRLLLGAAGLAGAAALAKLAHAGPIAPPAGPVAPTGVTLSEVAGRASATAQGVAEPRIPVSAQTTPGSPGYLYILSAPGSYYLTGNITSALQNAIGIIGEDITLDLCGFKVVRSGTAGTSKGLFIDGNRITIRNGSISGFSIAVEGVNFRTHLLTEDLFASGASSGIKLNDRSIARRCICSGAITAIEATGDNSVISDCVVSGPGDVGIWVNSSSAVERCHVSGVNQGIVANGSANRVLSCTAASNLSLGIAAGSNGLVQDCLVNSNGAAGIRAGGGSRIRGCSIAGHAAAGAAAVRLTGGNNIVEDNFLLSNNTGVDALNVIGNLIVRNTMLSNTNSIAVNLGGNWYPNIPLGGVNTSTNPLNNIIG